MKRAFDIALSATGLILSSPLWAILAIAIRLDDGGPIFFGQLRYGLGGAPFTAYKLRSMVARASMMPAIAATVCIGGFT